MRLEARTLTCLFCVWGQQDREHQHHAVSHKPRGAPVCCPPCAKPGRARAGHGGQGAVQRLGQDEAVEREQDTPRDGLLHHDGHTHRARTPRVGAHGTHAPTRHALVRMARHGTHTHTARPWRRHDFQTVSLQLYRYGVAQRRSLGPVRPRFTPLAPARGGRQQGKR